MKLFIVGFICMSLGAVVGYITAALMCASGNEERCRECRENVGRNL